MRDVTHIAFDRFRVLLGVNVRDRPSAKAVDHVADRATRESVIQLATA
jgi:hypothetical protein